MTETTLGETLYTRLDNGLTVILKPMRHAPVASFWMWYRVGSRNERPGGTGISHWVEHMLFKGTPNFPSHVIKRAIEREGGFWNGMTWIDWTTYFETLPAHRFDLALRLEADRMQNTRFDPDEVGSERTVIISEREGHENSPAFRLAEEVQALAFRVHPYHHEVIGDKADLETMTRDQLYEHYRTYYSPTNAVAVAAGDFDPAALLDRIEALFGAVPAGPAAPPVRRAEPPQQGERRVHIVGPDPTPYLTVAYHVPGAMHPDFFPLVVLDTVLGGVPSMSLFGSSTQNRTSRLYRALVETELATSASSAFMATIDPFLFFFHATVREGRDIADVEAAVLREVERVVAAPIEAAEVAKAIKQTRAQFAYATETVTNQAYWLGNSEVLGDYRFFETYLDRLQAVSAEDVQRVAAEYLKPTNRVVGWYTPEASHG